MRPYLLCLAALALSPMASSSLALAGESKGHDAIIAAVASPVRTESNRPRDTYRHPVETLSFFDVQPGQTVIEYQPSGGWYAEILAPLVKDKGHYVALTPPGERYVTGVRKMFDARPDLYAKARLDTIDLTTGATTLQPASADRLLTFRNIHNMMMINEEAAARGFAAFYAALKPGGILGVEDHRLPESADAAREKTSGYVKRSTVVRLAEAAGFKLAAESEVNANPKDTADWPDGVWTLPPALRLGDKDRDRYLAIGESDRMTLKFIKTKK